MKIRIISYEDVNGWILGKFALNLEKHLKELGHDVDIDNKPNSEADINHHIIYLNYNNYRIASNSIHTMMLTHFDDISKVKLVDEQLKYGNYGICMSRHTMDKLQNFGLPKENLCYINPAVDGIIKPKKYNIGLTTRVYRDGCKRESLLSKLIEEIDPAFFKFTIMGDGWQSIISKMEKLGYEVSYLSDFNYNKYIQMVSSFDYYVYLGQDEGSMGFIDALSAGVPTITTPQGFHLDADKGLVHPFDTYQELKDIFLKLEVEKSNLINSIKKWTWKDYAIKHLELWNYLKNGGNVKSDYSDGLNSLLDNSVLTTDKFSRSELMKGSIKRKINRIKNVTSFSDFVQKTKNYINHSFKSGK